MGLELNYKKFLENKMSKSEYIKNNYEEVFSPLFDISAYLNKTDIKSIVIERDLVVMHYCFDHMLLACEKNEYRSAPLETINFLKYEEEEVSMFLKLTDNKKCFFDIGANVGFYSIRAALRFKGLKVHAFEPIPKIFKTLNYNVGINNLSNRIFLNNIGLSNKPGSADFYIYPFGGTNASLVNVSEAADVVEVKTRLDTLDQYCLSRSEFPDIIKCDVEGAEKLVIEGGEKIIRDNLPIILLELLRKWSSKFDYHPNDVLIKLKSFGYCCYSINQSQLKEIETIDEHTIETNFFFLHLEKHRKEIQENLKQ